MLKRSFWFFQKTGFEQIIYTKENQFNIGQPITEYLLNDDRGKLSSNQGADYRFNLEE